MDNNIHLANTILSISREAIAICDRQQQIIQVNRIFCQQFAVQEHEVLGKNILELLMGDGRSKQMLTKEIDQTLKSQSDWCGEIQINLKNNTSHTMQCCLRPSLNEPKLSSYMVVIFWAIEHKGQNIRSHHDKLTGLPKQYLFVDRIAQSLITAPRANKSVALLMIGLDRFNLINDGLGYDIGDAVLKAFAKRLEHAIRRSDTVARLEGDKFGIVMQIATVEDSVIVAEKILKALGDSIVVGQQTIAVTASIGISIFPTDSSQGDSLLIHAESAMRHTKKLGGNHYQFFSMEMNNKAKSRIKLEHRLRKAIENQELVVYYQPKVNLETNAIVGAEALVRWLDPEKGLISPGEFIPVAEETGLIGKIGAIVLCTACRQNSQWYRKGLASVRISVNVTASQFRENDLIEKVKEVLKETQLPPELLELEITESMLVGDMEQVIDKLNAFREIGMHVSIDDFGTGYSSLNYLSRFPITTLKIDRAFIQGIEHDNNTAEITRAIIGLSHGLSLEVVAEGAENIEHIKFLREQGCDLVQGFYYSRPLPAQTFEKLLETGYLYDDEDE